MFISIFTDEFRLDVEQAFPIIRSWGLGYVDLRGRVFRKGCERLTTKEIARVKALLDEHGLKLGAFQSSLCKAHLPDRERQQAELEKLEGIIRAADALDCRLVRSFNYWQPKGGESGEGGEEGDRKGALAVQPDQMQRVLDAFEPVAKRAREAGLVLAFENCGQTCAEVAALVDALGVPEWGLAWDASNGWESDARKRDETEYLVANARRARMVHVKAKSAVAELGSTVLPWDRILATCSAAGLEGPVSVETHNPGGSPLSHEDASRKTVEFIKGAMPSAAPGDIYSAAKPEEKPEVHRPYEDNPVGFVVVGLGMGHGRSKTVTRTPGARLVGVCDIREERAKRSGEAYGVKYTTDIKPWLDDPAVEAVYVLTETGNHGKVAMQALEAGKHVLTTKPMDANVRNCDEMIRLAEKKGLTLGVDFGRRFEPGMLSLRKAVRSGFFGRMLGGTLTLKILRAMEYFRANGGWRGTRELDGGGVLSNQCIHEIDTVAFTLGIPKRVRCDIWTQAHDIEAEDLGCATWLYEDGAVIHHYATSSYPFATWYNRLELHGTEGAFVAERGGPSKRKSNALYFKKEGDWSEEPPETVEPEWLSAADNFAAALRTGAPLVCDGRDGRRTQSILEALYVSAYEKDGGWVDVEPELPGPSAGEAADQGGQIRINLAVPPPAPRAPELVTSVGPRPAEGLFPSEGSREMKLAFMSSVYPPLSVADLIAKAKEFGYEGIEFRPEWGHGHGVELDASAEARNDVRKAMAEAGLEACCLSPGTRFTGVERTERDMQLMKLQRYVELAAECGIPRIRVFGDPLMNVGRGSRNAEYAILARYYLTAAEWATKAGVLLCIETHSNFRAFDTGEVIFRAGYPPALKVNWHLGHCLRHGEDVDEAYRHVKGLVEHVHFGVPAPEGDSKDGAKRKKKPAAGTVHVERQAELLLAEGFKGYFSVEVIKPPDGDEVMRRHAEFWKGLRAKLAF